MDFSLSNLNLFDEYALKLNLSYKNSTDNDAIIVNNCIYYKKTDITKG
jgi:hypothetical protein